MREVVRCAKRGAQAILLILGLRFIVTLYDLSVQHQESLVLQREEQLVNDESFVELSQLRAVAQERRTSTFHSQFQNKSRVISNLDDVTFETEDMRDEHGESYKIVIWENRTDMSGYLANPKECLGNIECDISYDTANVHKAHAVVFPANNVSTKIFSRTRHPWQLYAWWTLESPLHTKPPLNHWDNFYNLTFHYRLDADVYAPYGSINLILRLLAKANESTVNDLLAIKRQARKMVAWAVSNCNKDRMNFAKSLMDAGLQVDTFGSCFGGRKIGDGKYSASFYERLSEYRFYFAFENSIGCKDYITEKFWFNGLRSGAVPIVWGPRKSDLLKVAPSRSFIHTSDFSTPGELVSYLKYLVSNETAYAEYLHWRTWIDHPERIETHLRMENRENDLRSFCKLCAMVQADGRRRKKGQKPITRVIPSLTAAWRGTEKGLCHH